MMKFLHNALFFTTFILIFQTTNIAGRHYTNRGLLKEILKRHDDIYYNGGHNRREDIYFGGEHDPLRISADQLPQNGAIFEGDIVMDSDLRNAVLGKKRSALLVAEVGQKKHWPNGRVPFLIDSSLREEVKQQVYKAIKEFRQCTCVRFEPKQPSDKDYVVFKDGKGCSSVVGRSGGRQVIHLALGCKRIGTVMHEMMHALGIIHEQSRPDRDEFLQVKYQNIKKDMIHNFQKYTYLQSDNMDIPYNFGGHLPKSFLCSDSKDGQLLHYTTIDDVTEIQYTTLLKSVMHYSNHAFSRNDEDTLVAKIDPSLRFGQRRQLTPYDVEQINTLYPCSNKDGLCEQEDSSYELVEDMTPSDVLQKKRDEEMVEKLFSRY